jgi:hypothetical protein
MSYKSAAFNVRRALYELYHDREIQPGERLYAEEGSRLNINPAQQDCRDCHRSTTELNKRGKGRLQKKLANFTVQANGCHTYNGKRTKAGYAMVAAAGNQYYLHRASWEAQHKKAIPPKMVIAHWCNNPPCINAEHLYLTTQAGNLQQMRDEGRAVCPAGRTSSKITEEQAEEIILTYCDGKDFFVDRAEQLGMSYGLALGSVKNILYGVSWRDVWFRLEQENKITAEQNRAHRYANSKFPGKAIRRVAKTKRARCREIYDPTLTRKENIKVFMEQLDLSWQTASSYQHLIKKERRENGNGS